VKRTLVIVAALAVIAAVVAPRVASAQEKTSPLVPLKVQLVI
jgi:hypothetical protein